MSERLTDRRVIWRALHEAYENVEGLSDAYGHNSENAVVQDCQRFLAALDRVGARYFGKTVSGARAEPFKDAKCLSLSDVLKNPICNTSEPGVAKKPEGVATNPEKA